jgi:hypothetical protein
MLNFRDRPSAFKTGSAKVKYAISYLTGTALQYCKPAILGEIQPESPWLGNWDLFKAELKFNFGPSTTQPKPRSSSKNRHEGASQSSQGFHCFYHSLYPNWVE